ncbi:hypothetical protein ALP90_200043 [Pseudomonas amygdali pv. ulmi]|uniref:Uncharacterized protein n=1 Tax=Pseudomonas amygdali pv. ulmi TaxID=251720 RepID=A0A3M4S7X2_PSEA0|nr:hypothetical protein ALP90_200043 [Pseudomonas amygdali pv. ulmi]
MTRHLAIFHFRRTHVDADQIGNLTTAINPARARAPTRSALSQTDDQLLAKLAHRQRVNGVVDGLATNVCIFKVRKFHGVELAGNLLRRKAFSQQVDNQLEQFAPRQQFSIGPANGSATSHVLMGLIGRVSAGIRTVAAKLTADGRRTSVKCLGDSSLTQALELAKLDRDAFFNAEFMI